MKALELTPAPHLRGAPGTAWMMRSVFYALAPAILAAVFLFGLSAVLVLAVTTAGCVFAEMLWCRMRGEKSTVGDFSAALTGLLLGLTLPPACPLWMAMVGAVFAMLVGKLIFGGLGANLFNPALVGRVFLQSTFPEALGAWSAPLGPARFTEPFAATLTLPFAMPVYDGLSGATPLAARKWETLATPLRDLLLGTHAGSLGETSGVLLCAGGLYLAARRVLNWRIPLAIFASSGLIGLFANLIDPVRFAAPVTVLFSGGLMLGAWFMATDPVTSPLTRAGVWVFGALIGALVMVIRVWGGLAEGVMYAILIANGLSPLIDRLTQARAYGNVRRAFFGR